VQENRIRNEFVEASKIRSAPPKLTWSPSCQYHWKNLEKYFFTPLQERNFTYSTTLCSENYVI